MINLKGYFLLMMLVAMTANLIIAQPQYYNYNTAGGSNFYPWNRDNGMKTQFLYKPGSLNQPTLSPAGNITSLWFRMYANLGPWIYSDLTIRLGQTVDTVFAPGGFYTGSMDTVYYNPSATLTGIAGQWMTITLDSTFYYDPVMSLVVEISYCGAPGSSVTACASTTTVSFANACRIWSNAGCPFTYAGTTGIILHMGISIDNPTNITEQEVEHFSVYPIRNNGIFMASITCPDQENFSLAIYDMLGTLLYEQKNIVVNHFAQHTVDAAFLSSGIYLVAFTSSERKYVSKVIVNK